MVKNFFLTLKIKPKLKEKRTKMKTQYKKKEFKLKIKKELNDILLRRKRYES